MNRFRSAYVLGPVFLGAYGILRILDGLDGTRGPGVAWTAGHVCYLVALAFFVVIFRDMRVRAGRGVVGAIGFWAAIAGTVAFAGQFGIDIVVGFLSADHAAMAGYYRGVQSVPGTGPAFYSVGPLLFFVGLLSLATLLAVRRYVGVRVPVLALLGTAVPLADKDLIPLGAVLLFLAFTPLRRSGESSSAGTSGRASALTGAASSARTPAGRPAMRGRALPRRGRRP